MFYNETICSAVAAPTKTRRDRIECGHRDGCDFGLNFSSPVEKPPPPTIEPKHTALIHAPPSLNSNPIIFESKQICYPHAPVTSKMRLAITTN